MNYFKAMLFVLKLDEKVYQEIASRGFSVRYSMINVLVLGILYGISSLFFIDPESLQDIGHPSGIMLVKFIVIITGILIAFLLHMGAAFLLWSFGRGVGGEGRFLSVYFNLGVAIVPLWFAVPGLAALQAGGRTPVVTTYAAVAGIYTLFSFFMATKSTLGLSYGKMFLAVAMMLVFIISFLYLWI
jgi:hypothetical protein